VKQEMLDLCARAVQKVRQAGAENCKATVDRSRFVDIQYREKKPETIQEAGKQTLSVDIYADGRYSSQATCDLRKGPLDAFLENAVAATKLLAKDAHRGLPDPSYFTGMTETDLKIRDTRYEKRTPEQRHETARTVENASLSLGGDKVVSVTAGTGDQISERAVTASNGFEGYWESTFFYAGAQVTLRDEGDRRPLGYYYPSTRLVRDLPDGVLIGETAVKRTLNLLGARKIPTETLPVIVENQNVPQILNGLIGALYGSNVQQKRSFLADKRGQKIGGGVLTVVDDPLLTGGLASAPFDGDGMAAARRVMIDSGVLKEYFVNWYYSRKLGWEPTTGGPSNLIIPSGTRSVDQIMKDLGRGIFINGFLGGNSNSTTGDFSIGIQGQLFENGVPVQAVAEMNIAGNHLEFWNKLAEAANDPWTYDSWRMPSLVFKDVVVSGV
jgi:PmbA protein